MFRSTLAKLAVNLDIDTAVNRVMEGLYTNTPDATPRLARRFQVLCYHKVSPDPHPFFEPIAPEIFEQQMKFLSRCYRVMPLMELMERNRRGDIPDRAVAITFDDGYRDNYEYAFPILKKYRLPATIFVATSFIDNRDVLWHDRVFDSFRFATAERAHLRGVELPELMLQTLEDRRRSILPVLVKAKQLYGEARLRFVEEVENALKPALDESTKQRMLTWQQLREMQLHGIDCGSHTVTHPIMTRIPRDEMVKEVVESKRQLAEHLDAPVAAFAYPNGQVSDYNHETKAVLREAGYSLAVTSQFGVNQVFSDAFEVRRGQPWHQQIELFRLAFFLQRHGVN
jgi:peptidoglycan/xylan/chitin deacetylase (PgdA/CDA1 family)